MCLSGLPSTYHLAEPDKALPALEEVTAALLTLRNHRAPGPDGIHAEPIKKGADNFMYKYLTLQNKIRQREERPIE